MFGPVGWQMCGQSHEFLGIELSRLPTVDDRVGDIRCEPGEAEQRVTGACPRCRRHGHERRLAQR
jgi:hypothetical protein